MNKPFDGLKQPAGLEQLERMVVQQSMLLSNLTEEAKRSHSATTALIALAQALIESHPAPETLARSFLDQIDSIGSLAMTPGQVDMYRDDIQKLNGFILDVVQRRNGSGSGQAR